MSYQTLHAAACRNPDRSAVIYHDKPISYARMVNAIDATIQVFERYQLPSDQPAGIVIHNLLDSWIVVLALQALGVPTVCARTTTVIDALGFAADITLVTTEPDVASDTEGQFADRSGAVICIPAPSLREDTAGVVPAIRSDAKFASHIVYTSGTTGNYKRLLWGGALQQQRNSESVNNRRYCGADTVHHGLDFGLWTGAGYRIPLRIWQLGGSVIFDQRPRWCERFLQPSVTHTTLTPDKALQLVDYLRSKNIAAPMERLDVMVTGGFVSRALAEEFLRRVTRTLVYAYASTEMNAIVLDTTVSDVEDLQWLLPTSARAVEIVDESGSPCPVGVQGHLRIQPSELDCNQYLDDAHSSAKVFRQGWYYPGDMAVQRGDGRIRILGRSADVINVLGQKRPVAPFEQQIQHDLGVGAVCVFSGIDDAGKEIAVITLEAEQWPEQQRLDKLARSLTEFQEVQFALFQRFPRTQTGWTKIDRVALRQRVFASDIGAAAG